MNEKVVDVNENKARYMLDGSLFSFEQIRNWFTSWLISDVECNVSDSRSFDSLSSPLSGFAKFEEKKRHQTDRKTKSFRSVFRKSPTPSPSKSPELRGSSKDRPNSASSLTPHHPGSPKISPHKPAQDSEKDQVRNEINTFLGQFPKQIVHDVVVKVKQCEQDISRACRSGDSVEEISDLAQDFYRNFKGKVDMVPCYQSMTAEDKETLMDLIEKYLTISLYKELFSPVSTTAEDEIKDLGLQTRYIQSCLYYSLLQFLFLACVFLSAFLRLILSALS